MEINIVCKICGKSYSYMGNNPSYKKSLCSQCVIFNKKMAGKIFRSKFPGGKVISVPSIKIIDRMVWDQSNEVGY